MHQMLLSICCSKVSRFLSDSPFPNKVFKSSMGMDGIVKGCTLILSKERMKGGRKNKWERDNADTPN